MKFKIWTKHVWQNSGEPYLYVISCRCHRVSVSPTHRTALQLTCRRHLMACWRLDGGHGFVWFRKLERLQTRLYPARAFVPFTVRQGTEKAAVWRSPDQRGRDSCSLMRGKNSVEQELKKRIQPKKIGRCHYFYLVLTGNHRLESR